jgi:hypothetical protein
VFRPGGTPGANVYTVWQELMAALDSTEGLRILEFDDSLESPCIIPAGTWNMRDVTWTGYAPRFGAPVALVEIQEGAILPELRLITGQLEVTCMADTTPPVSDFGEDGGGGIVQIGNRLDNGVTVIRCMGGAPLFDFGANAVSIQNNGRWNAASEPFSTTPPGRVAIGGQVGFQQMEQGLIGPNAIDAPVGSTVIIDFQGGAPISNVQSTIKGELTYRNPRFRSRFRVLPQSVGGAAPVPAPAPIDEVQTGDFLLLATDGHGSQEQELPSITDSFQSGAGPALTMGHLLIVKNAGGGTAFVRPRGGDRIDGSTAAIGLPADHARIFCSDGVSNWYIVAGYGA